MEESTNLTKINKEENNEGVVGSKRARDANNSEYEDKPSERENIALESPSANTGNTTGKRDRKKMKHFDEEYNEASQLSQGTPSSHPTTVSKTTHLENKQTSISSISSQISSISSIEFLSSTSHTFLETLTSINPDTIEASLCKVLSEQKRELEEKLRAINSDLEKITSRLKEKETSQKNHEEYSPTASKPPQKTKKTKLSKKKTTKQIETQLSTTPKTPRSKRSAKPNDEPENGVVLSSALLSCQKVLNSLIRHKYSSPFLEPVDPVLLGIPDYFRIIKHPMDLGTIKKKLLAGKYGVAKEFVDDVFIVFDNACTYNHPGSDVYIMSETLRDFFIKKLPSIKEKVILPDHNVNNNTNTTNNTTTNNNTTTANNTTINNNSTTLNQNLLNNKGNDQKSVNNNTNNDTTKEVSPMIDHKNENLIATTDKSGKENIIIIKKKPVKEEIKWTREDKLRLSGSISKLNEKNLHDVFQIIKNSTYVDANEKEVVFDLDILDHNTLNQLDQYIAKVNSKKTTKKSSSRSTLSSSSSTNLVAPKKVTTSASQPTSPVQSPPTFTPVDSSLDHPKQSSILPEDIPQIVKPATNTKIEIENVSWMSLSSEKDNSVEEVRTSSESLWSEFQNKDFLNKQKEKERREREERLRREREEKEEERRREELRLLKEKEEELIRLEREKEEARIRAERELEELRQKEIEERERAKQKTSIEEEEEDIEQFVGSMESYGNLELQPITFNRTN